MFVHQKTIAVIVAMGWIFTVIVTTSAAVVVRTIYWIRPHEICYRNYKTQSFLQFGGLSKLLSNWYFKIFSESLMLSLLTNKLAH